MFVPPFLIVWDLDRTIGVFDALDELEDRTQPVTIHLRPGIDEALTRLSKEGFFHTVLTLASQTYAEVVLTATGLRKHFLEISGGCNRPKGDAPGLAETFRIPKHQLPQRMLFVGDHPWYDAPNDPRIVFHLEPKALRRPAEPVADLIILLRNRGHGSLREGFDALVGPCPTDNEIMTVEQEGLGKILLLPREKECPIIGFDEESLLQEEGGTPFTFIPADIDLDVED